MHERIIQIIKDEFPDLQKSTDVYNIFPQFIPDGAIGIDMPKAIAYNIIDTHVDLNLSVYRFQFTCVNKDYSSVRSMALRLKNLFNAKQYQGVNVISTVVEQIIDLQFDKVASYYSTAVIITVKSQVD